MRRRGRGTVARVAESAISTVQSLIRWDPAGHADLEFDARAEVGLPPAVHIAAIDGEPAAVNALLEIAELPDSAQLLGPVDLPSGARRPPGVAADTPVSRMLVRVPRDGGLGAGGGAAKGHRCAQRAPRSTANSRAN